MSEPHDMRLNNSWALWCKRLLDEHPDRKTATDGESYFAAFCSGWHYRFEAAMHKFGGDGRDDRESTLVRDQMDLFQREYKRAFEMFFGYHEASRTSRRVIASQRAQIQVLGGDPLEAPAFRRISEQRKEIKRLTRELAILRGLMAAGEAK